MNTRFAFSKLDARTRKLMVQEIMVAVRTGNIYYSGHFDTFGHVGWVQWLTVAAMWHDPKWLARRLNTIGVLASLPNGGTGNAGNGHGDSAKTDGSRHYTCAEKLAFSQFNRFYMAAVCRRAIEDGVRQVMVCRCMQDIGTVPDLQQEDTIRYDAEELLDDLRNKTLSQQYTLLDLDYGQSIDYEPESSATKSTDMFNKTVKTSRLAYY